MMNKEISYDERSQFYKYELVDTIDIPFIKSLIKDDTTLILEIPCGTGSVVFEIACEKYNVTAADIEPGMVKQLENRIAKHPFKNHITPKIADMCSFDFEDTFDLIVVPREAFQLIEGYDD
ncbi:class I SAM-dependent methyltransferase, partial [Eubacterium aggregans]|uniref:class I SAM-dependent methyltransferase n=1 Tax=Eubacterium aggregans TaxID=81409 RepID=UPI003F397073